MRILHYNFGNNKKKRQTFETNFNTSTIRIDSTNLYESRWGSIYYHVRHKIPKVFDKEIFTYNMDYFLDYCVCYNFAHSALKVYA